MFRRRRHRDEHEDQEEELATGEIDSAEASDEPDQQPVEETGPGRENGPWDASEVDDPASGGQRIDLGAMFLPGHEGMELRIEVDEATGVPAMITVVLDEGVLQVQPFAAPRTAGIWSSVRTELRASITQQGGLAEDREGPFGTEVDAKIPVQLPDGGSGLQAARFIGVDGPRWFLRGVISGAAYEDQEIAAVLEAIFRDVVVVRGAEAMAPRDPLPLRMPQPGPEGASENAGDADTEAEPEQEGDKPGQDQLNPFKRGPEITEVR